MKHSLLIITASAAIAALSCQKETSFPESSAQEPGVVTISAGFCDTRTSIDGNTGEVQWSAHEQILMFPSRYGQQVYEGKVFTSTNDTPQKTAEFTGVLPTADFEFTDYWAIYPVHADAFCNGDYINGSLPASQTGIPDTFPDDLCVAAAYTTDPYHLYFQHPLSGLRFSVQSAGIKRVVFRSNSNFAINGNYDFACENGVVVSTGYTQIGDEHDYVGQAVTELIPQDGTFEPGRSYYIVLLPLPMSGGFTLLFERSDGKYAYKTVTKDVDFKRATFRTLMDADAGLEWMGGEPQLSVTTVDLTSQASYFAVDVVCPSGEYTVESDCDWIREVAPKDDVISYGDALNLNLGGYAPFQGFTHGFLCKANTGAARTGHIVFKQNGKDYPVTVNQEAGTLPVITRHHLAFTMRSIDRQSDWYKRDLLWETRASFGDPDLMNIAEGFYGSNGSSTFLTGKWLTWQYRNWGAIDGRVTLAGSSGKNSTDDVLAWMNESDDYYPPLTSIAVTSSEVDSETRVIKANVQVYAAKAGTYKLTGVVIEESASYGNGGMYTKNSSNLIVAMLTDYNGQSFTIDSDDGTASFELSVTAPAEVHSSATGNWGDLDQMQLLLYTQVAYGTQAKVRVTAPLNNSTYYIDNSRIVTPGATCGFEVE